MYCITDSFNTEIYFDFYYISLIIITVKVCGKSFKDITRYNKTNTITCHTFTKCLKGKKLIRIQRIHTQNIYTGLNKHYSIL